MINLTFLWDAKHENDENKTKLSLLPLISFPFSRLINTKLSSSSSLNIKWGRKGIKCQPLLDLFKRNVKNGIFIPGNTQFFLAPTIEDFFLCESLLIVATTASQSRWKTSYIYASSSCFGHFFVSMLFRIITDKRIYIVFILFDRNFWGLEATADTFLSCSSKAPH